MLILLAAGDGASAGLAGSGVDGDMQCGGGGFASLPTWPGLPPPLAPRPTHPSVAPIPSGLTHMACSSDVVFFKFIAFFQDAGRLLPSA